MKNNILYIIGVAFALVLMVFFSGFFKNVDFFPADSRIINGKTILIETFNDKKADEYWENQFIKLYENSDFKPTDEMFNNASLCFKEEVLENIINNESEKYQKILETEIKIETKDQYVQESKEILSKFQRDFQGAVNTCIDRHIEKEEVTELQCDTTEIYELWHAGLTPEEWIEKGISRISRDKRIIFVSFTSNEASNTLTISNLNGNFNNEITFFENECSKWNLKGISCLKKTDIYDGSINLNRLDGSIFYNESLKLVQNDDLGVTSIEGTCKKNNGTKNKF